MESAAAIVTDAINEYVRVEMNFDDLLLDDVVRNLAKSNTESLQTVIDLNLAHQQLPSRSKIVSSLLRQVVSFGEKFGSDGLPADLMDAVTSLTQLKDKVYGSVRLDATAIIEGTKIAPFQTRVDELRTKLADGTDLEALATDVSLSAGVDLLTSLFSDSDDSVRAAAIEVYIRRVYRAYNILSLDVEEIDGRTTCSFTFQFSDVPVKDGIPRNGMLSVVPDIGAVPSVLDNFESKFGSAESPLHALHLAVTGGSVELSDIEPVITSNADKLRELGIRTANTVIPVEKK